MFCKFVSPRNLWKWNSLGNVEARLAVLKRSVQIFGC
jgi:hypothetical protein